LSRARRQLESDTPLILKSRTSEYETQSPGNDAGVLVEGSLH